MPDGSNCTVDDKCVGNSTVGPHPFVGIEALCPALTAGAVLSWGVPSWTSHRLQRRQPLVTAAPLHRLLTPPYSTNDTCNPATGCVFQDDDSLTCDLNETCYPQPSCSSGTCSSPLRNCSLELQATPCSIPICVFGVGCEFDNTTNNGRPCPPDDLCADSGAVSTAPSWCMDADSWEQCSDGECIPNPKDCGSSQCHVGQCNPSTGDCFDTPINEGQLCDPSGLCFANGTVGLVAEALEASSHPSCSAPLASAWTDQPRPVTTATTARTTPAAPWTALASTLLTTCSRAARLTPAVSIPPARPETAPHSRATAAPRSPLPSAGCRPAGPQAATC